MGEHAQAIPEFDARNAFSKTIDAALVADIPYMVINKTEGSFRLAADRPRDNNDLEVIELSKLTQDERNALVDRIYRGIITAKPMVDGAEAAEAHSS